MDVMLRQALERRLEALAEAGVVRRIWERDPTVWVDDPATPELKERLGAPVHLSLWVKVREGWSDSDADLRRFGYESE